jgi:hypothetical protein
MKNFTLSNIPTNFNQFSNIEEKDKSVADFFSGFDSEDGVITSSIIGRVLNEENEEIGYCEEHYMDSGSDDYHYTVVIY